MHPPRHYPWGWHGVWHSSGTGGVIPGVWRGGETPACRDMGGTGMMRMPWGLVVLFPEHRDGGDGNAPMCRVQGQGGDEVPWSTRNRMGMECQIGRAHV